jgi:ribosomal protein S18 acetylase RimI-like enzyme
MVHIEPSVIADSEVILKLYESAIEYQKKKFHRHWYTFDPLLLAKEIRENKIAGCFSVTFDDFLIWGERAHTPALYLHRIVTAPDYHGMQFVRRIIDWARDYGQMNKLKYIRLDTCQENQKLNDYYIQHGFLPCGIREFSMEEQVPRHYREGALSLFEMPI